MLSQEEIDRDFMMAKADIDKLLGRSGRRSHKGAQCSIIEEDNLTND